MTEYSEQPSGGTNTLAIVGLILGIISIIAVFTSCCVLPLVSSIIGTVCGIAALILGLTAKKQILSQGGAPSQMKLANASFILGLIGSILGVISVVIAIITQLVLAGPFIEQQFQDILDQLENP